MRKALSSSVTLNPSLIVVSARAFAGRRKPGGGGREKQAHGGWAAMSAVFKWCPELRSAYASPERFSIRGRPITSNTYRPLSYPSDNAKRALSRIAHRPRKLNSRITYRTPFHSFCSIPRKSISAPPQLEAPGPGIIGALVTQVQQQSSQTVSTSSVDYPATLTNYASSSAQGTAATKTLLMNQVSRCPNQKIVLVGYSQV